jgi:hypothetical protein
MPSTQRRSPLPPEWTPRSWAWRPAHRERELLAARAAEVFALVGHVRPRTIPRTRPDIERLARDAEAATMRGPEVAPVLPDSFLLAEAEQPMIEPMAETF